MNLMAEQLATQQGRPVFKTAFRTPPQDIGVEQAMLGAVMIKPEGMVEIVDVVHPEDFYSEKHRLIFKTMLALYDKHEPIDIVSLSGQLKANKKLDAVDGSSYLAELINLTPSPTNLKYYAELVHKKSTLRKLIACADEISSLGYNEADEIESVIDQAQQAVFRISSYTKRSFLKLKDTLAEAWERFDHLHKSKNDMRGLPTGFHDLDNKLAGLQKSDLVILAARPSMGKTSLAIDIARHVACHQKKSVGIFSLEMSSQQLVDRLIAAESWVDAWRLRTGRLSEDEDFDRIRDALDRLAAAPLFIDDEPMNTITRMKAVARKLKLEHGLELIVVDYLQLMVPLRDRDSLVQQVTEISRSLKGLARELEVPVLALSQLNRAVEQRGGKPRLSDLRDSGSIEQDADVVLFIHREDKYKEDSTRKNIADLMIAKHRNGPTGEIQLYFDESKVSFQTIEKGEFGKL